MPVWSLFPTHATIKDTNEIRIKRSTKSESHLSLESSLWHFVSSTIWVSIFNFGKFHIAQFTISPTAATTVCLPFGIWTKPKCLLAKAAFTGLGSTAYWLGGWALEPDHVGSDPASDTWCLWSIFRKALYSSVPSFPFPREVVMVKQGYQPSWFAQD